MGGFGSPFFFMTTLTYATSTELDAVNSILMSVGESPVNTLDTQSPEVAIAQKTLRQVCREVQAEGWAFNSEIEFPLPVDNNNEIEFPANALQVDPNRYKHADNYDVVRRTRTLATGQQVAQLYDRYKHTNKFTDLTENILYCDVIWLYEFDDMPQPFRDYVTAKASRIASNRMIASPEANEVMSPDETLARASCIQYDTNQADYNIFQDSSQRNPYQSYQPFQVIKR